MVWALRTVVCGVLLLCAHGAVLRNHRSMADWDASPSSPSPASASGANGNGATGNVSEHFPLVPVIASVSAHSAPTSGGSDVVIKGEHFDFNGQVLVGGKACVVTFFTKNEIKCLLPAGHSADVEVRVFNAKGAFAVSSISYDPPSIDTYTQTLSTLGGDMLKLTGKNYDYSAVVSVGGAVCAIHKVDFQHIECTSPAAQAGGVAAVVVQVGNQRTVSVNVTYVAPPPPQVTGLTPSSGATTGEYKLTITGVSLPNTPKDKISVGSFDCVIQSQSEKQYVVLMPPGEGANLTVKLTSPALATPLYGEQSFSFFQPTIEKVTPSAYSLLTNADIVINGKNFGSKNTVVTIGDEKCAVTVLSHQRIVCTPLVPSAGGSYPLVVTVGGQRSSPYEVVFFYPPAPSLSSQTGSTEGLFRLTLTGSDFGGSSGKVTVGGSACEVQSYQPHTIVCLVAPGEGAKLPVVVHPSGRAPLPASQFSYSPPDVHSVTPSIVSPKPTELTITGANFGFTAKVTVGGKDCHVTVHSHIRLVCTSPALPSGSAQALQVHVVNQVSTPHSIQVK